MVGRLLNSGVTACLIRENLNDVSMEFSAVTKIKISAAGAGIVHFYTFSYNII